MRSNHGQFPISLDERNEATKRPGNFLRNSRKSHENQTRHPPNSDIIGKGEKLIDYSKLKSALKNLEVQTANLQGAPGRDGITKLDIEAIQESVIKRFDLAIEMTWKLLMKYLAEEIGIADVPAGPKPVLRLADQNNLLNARIEQWIEYVNARNASSHDYSGEKAEQTLKVIPDFITDAVQLYQTMSKQTWGQ